MNNNVISERDNTKNLNQIISNSNTINNNQKGSASSESSEDGAGSSASTSRGAGRWRSVFGAVSGRELRLYECAPWSPEAWASPSITCPLIATRGSNPRITFTRWCSRITHSEGIETSLSSSGSAAASAHWLACKEALSAGLPLKTINPTPSRFYLGNCPEGSGSFNRSLLLSTLIAPNQTPRRFSPFNTTQKSIREHPQL
ncbi:hypothetical protein HZH66_011391 [Vespula vulgaris]|uniref:Uncharacterized protein n=1 Tax=Vespula vulgaris TaxID=7454 RepID=A0A834JH00_VESVU|nr:hypothetical protein HZH66_011391 [Vespula vulgaris]